MHVWLLKDGEHLPLQTGSRRMRMWMLADALRAHGHDVTWFASTFSHQRKTRIAPAGTYVTDTEGIHVQLLEAGEYQRNVSVARWRHHARLAKAFREQARVLPKPHVIVAALPIIELAYEAVEFARAHDIPVIVDVRDLWPDVFIDKAPHRLRRLVRQLTRPMKTRVANLLSRATGIVGVSPGYLSWALSHAGRTLGTNDRIFYLGCEDPGPPNEVGRAAHPLTVAFVGSFGLSYDLDTVCDAAAILHDRGRTDIQFVLAGDGEQYETLMRRTATLRNITLTGWLSSAQIRALLSRVHMGVSPLRMIPNPSTLVNKIFDYLAAGLPILSSRELAIEELLTAYDAGTVFPRGDAAALTNAIVGLADDPVMRARQSRNARTLFETRFAARIIYEEYARYLEEIVAGAAGLTPHGAR